MDRKCELSLPFHHEVAIERLRSVVAKHADDWKPYTFEIDNECLLVQRQRRLFHYPPPIFSTTMFAEIQSTEQGSKLDVEIDIGPPIKYILAVVCVLIVLLQVVWLPNSCPHGAREWIIYAILNVIGVTFVAAPAFASYHQAKLDEMRMLEVITDLSQKAAVER
jgi:hypothetical protein